MTETDSTGTPATHRPTPAGTPRRAALGLLGSAITVAAAATSGSLSTAAARGRPTATDGEPAGRAARLVSRMTLDEKTGLVHGHIDPHSRGQAGYTPGVPRLGIPPLRLSDGPAGVRVTEHATALPAPVLMASAWDPALAHAYGTVLGREGRALGQDIQLAPMVNLIRVPYAGRNFETFSEDPLLTGDLGAEQVRGIQHQGMIATVKHLALNNQEKDRNSVDVTADERTMQELELRAFEPAVRAGAGAVMGAYNSVNGDFACENRQLLTEVLREQWNFGGFVMTDWLAQHSTVASLTAGLDMEMPAGLHYGAALKAAVLGGAVDEQHLDRAVARILTVMDRFGLLDGSAPPRPGRDPEAGARAAERIATAGGTLLRNENGALPLAGAAARSLAVIGRAAKTPLVSGGGSAHVEPDHASSPLHTLTERAGNAAQVRYADGSDTDEAVRLAQAAEAVIVFADEEATEGQDRESLQLPRQQDRLIASVAEANSRTVVVLNTSSATAMPWLERTAAVLQMYYPGQCGAEATTALLFGDANPGGKLTQTFPASGDAHPVAGDRHRYPGVAGKQTYSEGIHLGYRWYDSEGVEPLFPFGHGLSYTTFHYERPRTRRTGNGGLEVSFTLHNTGALAGAEVAQIYASPSPDLRLGQPPRVLAGYRRVELAAGERRRVTVRIAPRDLSSWDPNRHRWVLGTGRRTLTIGSSSRDLRLHTSTEVRGS